MLRTKFENAFYKVMSTNSTTAKLAALAGATGIIFTPNLAFAAGTMDGILTNLGNIVIAVIAIVGVIFTVKAVLDYMKGGDGSLGKIITTVLVVCLFIGLVLVLTNASSLANLFKPIADSGVQSASDLAGEVLG